ncbi:MAG: 30S ribosome-binding factor RbfA [Acidimicrobiia bacterium]|nr:30S ribosome-binding factor RbfA [Acidimicrobiia bacterium]
MSGRQRRPAAGGRRYPREARLNELLREILADELERIDDPDLEWMSIIEVHTDRDLTQATVLVSPLDDDADGAVLDALERHRRRLQAAIGRQARVRRTPPLRFEIDQTLRQAQRIDDILEGRAASGDQAPDSEDGDQGA